MKRPIVIAIDGTSASGKSTNSKLVAKALGFSHVDTGAMYRALAWYCLKEKVDLHNPKAIATSCRKWKTKLECVDQQVHLVVDGYYPAKEIRSSEVSVAVTFVASVPKVREWMKKTQRECAQFGNLVMEGRDIGTNVFPETDYKYFLDAHLAERSRRRAAEGVEENLAARDQRDSSRATSPLMVALGAKVINNSHMTSAETSSMILQDIRKRFREAGIELAETAQAKTCTSGTGTERVPVARPVAGAGSGHVDPDEEIEAVAVMGDPDTKSPR